jgi:serine acetyltransferase
MRLSPSVAHILYIGAERLHHRRACALIQRVIEVFSINIHPADVIGNCIFLDDANNVETAIRDNILPTCSSWATSSS